MVFLSAAETTAAITEAAETAEEKLSHFGEFLSNLGAMIVGYIPTFLVALGVLVAGWLLTKLVLHFMKKGIGKGKIEVTVANFAFSVVKIALYIILFSIVLTILGVPAASLVAVIGTAGVAIGLALQGSLSNVAGGFIILLEKPFRIGDYIETDGADGIVQRITILYTVIKTFDNRMVFIPNSNVSGKKVINNTFNKTRRLTATVGISYDGDFAKAKEALLAAFSADKNVEQTPAPNVFMSGHGESSVEITCLLWAKQENYWELYFTVNETIDKALKSAEIAIPYNQLDLHIIEKEK